jgi:hypothetical protein
MCINVQQKTYFMDFEMPILQIFAEFGQVITAIVALLIAYQAHKQAQKISEEQRKQSQNAAFIALHPVVNIIKLIDHKEEINWDEVTTNINSLELLAVAWDQEFVDREIIKNLYAHSFILVFDSIRDIKQEHPDLGLDGYGLLTKYAKISCTVYAHIWRELHGRRNKEPSWTSN